jgi:hypothetical protein
MVADTEADDLGVLEADLVALEEQVRSRRAELDGLRADRFIPPRAGFPWAALAVGTTVGFMAGLLLPIILAMLAEC